MGLSTITPETRSEEFIDRIARAMGSGGTSPLDTIVPETRHEEFIDRIARANGWTDVSPMASIYPETRMEEFLNRIADNAGAGGAVYEYGSVTTDSDVEVLTDNFSDTHDVPPTILIVVDSSDAPASLTQSNSSCVYIDYLKLFGVSIPWTTAVTRPSLAYASYRGTNSNSTFAGYNDIMYDSDNPARYDSNYAQWWASAESFNVKTGSNVERRWKSGKTFKWLAIWLFYEE